MQQDNITFIITKEQIEQLRPYMPNIDELVLMKIIAFQEELNDAIVYYLDSDNGYEETPTSMFLQDIYDEIYNQNKSEG